MLRLLILYGTTNGHTRKIAQVLGETLRGGGFPCDVIDAARVPPELDPASYDGVLVAASIHTGGYQRAVARWVHRHAEQLNLVPSAFVSVCLGILERRPEAQTEVRAIMNRFLQASGWQPTITKTVAGALLYTQYDWLTRWLMKRIVAKAGGDTDTSRDYEYTDWDDLRAFARAFARKKMTIGQSIGALP
jgi:menaquinone-dependent protoporphyrinogen oxidase